MAPRRPRASQKYSTPDRANKHRRAAEEDDDNEEEAEVERILFTVRRNFLLSEKQYACCQDFVIKVMRQNLCRD